LLVEHVLVQQIKKAIGQPLAYGAELSSFVRVGWCMCAGWVREAAVNIAGIHFSSIIPTAKGLEDDERLI